jgi:deoxyadenosine/deoxycytidine kinase
VLIAIEGCLGAGKSTVAKGLAAYRNSQLLLEDFEINPFLRAFYEDPVGNATETEFSFLLLHFHQLKRITDVVSSSEVITDFHLGKDVLYADLNLRDSQARDLFARLYGFLLEKTPRPALMVFLSAPTELLVERIRRRERDFEVDVDPGYYAAVNAAYEDFFISYSGRKLRLPMREWDFVQNKSLYENLSSMIDRELGE